MFPFTELKLIKESTVVVEQVDRVQDATSSPDMWDLANLESATPLGQQGRRVETKDESRQVAAKPNAPHPIC
jgi:hypothetical protein